MSRDFAPRGPAEIQSFLHTKRDELSALQNQVQAAHEALEEAEIAWAEHYDEIVGQLEEELDRLPGEEVRVSIARRRGGLEKWTNLRRAERLTKRLDKQASFISTQISAAQSEARLLGVV